MVNTYETVQVGVVDTHTVGTCKGIQPYGGAWGSQEDEPGPAQTVALNLWVWMGFSELLWLTSH